MSSTPNPVPTNLVLGMVHNYTFAQVRPFLLSLRQTGYAGKIVLFHHRVGQATQDEIRRMGVDLLPFHNLRGTFRTPGMCRFLNRLSQTYYRNKGPFYRLGWQLLLSAGKQRFLLYRSYLRKHAGAFSRVLLTDVRDVFFQRDPFSIDEGSDLTFFEESHPLAHGMFNPLWILHHFDKSTLGRLGAKTALCAGTILGRQDALISYLDEMKRLMQEANRMDFATGDQALHNGLVYERLGKVPHSVSICPNGQGAVYTLSRYIDGSRIPQSSNGEVVSPSGTVVPILHQYDRHPAIMRAVLDALVRRNSS